MTTTESDQPGCGILSGGNDRGRQRYWLPQIFLVTELHQVIQGSLGQVGVQSRCLPHGLCQVPGDAERSSHRTGSPSHLSLCCLNSFEGIFVFDRVVKDDPLQPRKPTFVPIIQIGFQDHPIRTLLRCREPFYQLIRPRAPRACPLDNSPMLLAPPEFAIKLAIANMHDTELGQDPPIRFGQDELHRVRIHDLQARPCCEV